jgi:hypothetical protein
MGRDIGQVLYVNTDPKNAYHERKDMAKVIKANKATSAETQQDQPTLEALVRDWPEWLKKHLSSQKSGKPFKGYRPGSKYDQVFTMLLNGGTSIPQLMDWYKAQGWDKGMNKNNLQVYIGTIRKDLSPYGLVVGKKDNKFFVDASCIIAPA